MCRSSCADDVLAQRLRRQRARRVARVHPRFLHVLHDAGDQDFAGAVAHGVDVDLDRVLQEPIHQHGPIGRDSALAGQRAGRHRLHDAAHAVVVVDDLHGAAAQDIARAEQDGIADLPGDGQRLGRRRRRSPGRLRNAELVTQRVPALAVLGQVDGGRARPEHQLRREGAGQLQGCLPAQGDDDPRHAPAGRQLGVEHVGHVLVGQRLEVEAVRRVVVGRDGLGVAVDHHRLVAGVAQGHGGVHAAIVELNALPDAVRARAENDHAGARRGTDLVLLLVGGVVVRREGLELGRARVDRLEGRPHPLREPGRTHVSRGAPRR